MNLNEHAIQISQQTGKDRGNCYKALKTLLAKIEQENITSLSYNSDFSQITINGIDFFQDARKHWKQKSDHQQKPVSKTVEDKTYVANQVEEVYVNDPAIALAARMLGFSSEMTKPVETPKPFYVGEQQEVLDENGNPVLIGGILVEHAKDSCTDDQIKIDAKACVYSADNFKQRMIDFYVSNGYSERDAEISANAQINGFITEHDPEMNGTYEIVSDDSFLFNGKETVLFDDEELKFQKQ
ncbi:TPA: hypothetical protein RQN22_001817 [Aeromonas dhakensis]|nr:hypothetical protein [Aeromonas dhakensis]